MQRMRGTVAISFTRFKFFMIFKNFCKMKNIYFQFLNVICKCNLETDFVYHFILIRCEVLEKHKIQQLKALNEMIEDRIFSDNAEVMADKLSTVSERMQTFTER